MAGYYCAAGLCRVFGAIAIEAPMLCLLFLCVRLHALHLDEHGAKSPACAAAAISRNRTNR
eukprot:832440-Amphidinium_carterae.1